MDVELGPLAALRYKGFALLTVRNLDIYALKTLSLLLFHVYILVTIDTLIIIFHISRHFMSPNLILCLTLCVPVIFTVSHSPSFSNLENSSRNLDMQELDYNPSKKDLTDARIHHLLAEELKPRRVSYFWQYYKSGSVSMSGVVFVRQLLISGFNHINYLLIVLSSSSLCFYVHHHFWMGERFLSFILFSFSFRLLCDNRSIPLTYLITISMIYVGHRNAHPKEIVIFVTGNNVLP